MAVTSTISYCTDRDLLDVFPNLASYSLKRRMYDTWHQSYSGTNYADTTLDLWFANGTGLVTELYFDGAKAAKIAYNNSTVATTVNAVGATGTTGSFYVTDQSELVVDDLIKVDNEYMLITALSDGTPDTATVQRAVGNTVNQTHAAGANIYRVMRNLVDMPDALSDSGDDIPTWVYDSDLDMVFMIIDNNPDERDPNNFIIEAGDDWTTIKTRFRRKASRLVEGNLDNRLAREVLKDREGNYPEIIVHCTALQTVILLLKAHDPNNETIVVMQEELDKLIEGLRTGKIVLPTAISEDSSKGVIREVAVNSASDLRPVELKGHYGGSGYELLKVFIESGENGVIGTTKMTVKGKSSTLLKNDVLIDSEIITGDFQSLGVGTLQIRWGGDDVTSAITTASDEYEVELWGEELDATISTAVFPIEVTRR